MDKNAIKIKLQSKQLEFESKRLQKQSIKEKQKAKRELKKGNRANAALFARNAALYDQQAVSMLQNVSAANGYAVDMRQASVNVYMSKSMSKAAKSMERSCKKVHLSKLSANRTKMEGLKQKMGAAHDLLTNGEGDMEINAGAEDLLASLDAENEQAAISELAYIPTGQEISGLSIPGNNKNVKNN